MNNQASEVNDPPRHMAIAASSQSQSAASDSVYATDLTDMKHLENRRTETTKNVHASTSSRTTHNFSHAKIVQDRKPSHEDRYQAQATSSSEVQTIIRPWQNIKRAKKTGAIVDGSPMERWDLERIEDQPWNIIGGFTWRIGETSDKTEGLDKPRDHNVDDRKSEDTNMLYGSIVGNITVPLDEDT
jgi:hypothetical protein